MLTVEYNGREYPLSATLRVAYNIQGQHNHASYLDIFEKIDKMTLEEQIGIVWASFAAANKDECAFIKRKDFQDYYLDNNNLGDLMNLVNAIVRGIMGKLEDDVESGVDGEDGNEDENFQIEPGMESLDEELK